MLHGCSDIASGVESCVRATALLAPDAPHSKTVCLRDPCQLTIQQIVATECSHACRACISKAIMVQATALLVPGAPLVQATALLMLCATILHT